MKVEAMRTTPQSVPLGITSVVQRRFRFWNRPVRIVVMKLLPRAAAILSLFAAAIAASAQSGGLLGDWKTKAGSIVRVERCGEQVCMRLVQVINTGGDTTDSHNPDPALRGRPLCGLEIGSGFKLTDPGHGVDGTLYDPKSGRTYRGNITAEGGALRLRGYIGIPLFGASETWARPTDPVKPCGK
jgi:uncharacterized protein (DUF2147 family)